MAVSKELLDILVCPKCQKKVELSGDEKYLLCGKCNLKYPIQEDIPVMLIDAAKPMEEKQD